MRKLTFNLLLIIVLFFVNSGCVYFERSTYHENVESVERYITNRLDDYITIKSFSSDSFFNQSQQTMNEVSYWNITFNKAYIDDPTQTEACSPATIVEKVRELYNDYVRTSITVTI